MLFDPNDTIGTLIQGLNAATGSTFITLLLLTTAALLLFMALASPFGWPFEFSIILILPLHLVIAAYVGNWMAVGGAFIIYIGILIAKNLLSR